MMVEDGKMHGSARSVRVWNTDILLESIASTTIGFYPRKHCHTVEAGLLACNIFAVLPAPGEAVDNAGKNAGVTYSCGTACDLHTIPY
jgi:hypothetical protein